MVRKLSKQFFIATWLVTFLYNFSIFWQLVLWQFLKNSGNVCFLDKNHIFIWTTTSIYYTVFAVSCSVVSNSLQPHGLYSPLNSLGQITGVGNLSLLQGIFPTQGSNPDLPHCGQILYQLSHKVIPTILEWVAYPFSSRSFSPRNQTEVSCIAGRFFTNGLWGKYLQYVPINIEVFL